MSEPFTHQRSITLQMTWILMCSFVSMYPGLLQVESSWNVMAHGDAREGKWRGKLANGVGSQYPSHYFGTRCIQHYYRWCHTPRGCQQSTELTPLPPGRFKWTRTVSRERRNVISAHVSSYLNGLGPFCAKDEIWFLRVCCHISTGLYLSLGLSLFYYLCQIRVHFCEEETNILALSASPSRNQHRTDIGWKKQRNKRRSHTVNRKVEEKGELEE